MLVTREQRRKMGDPAFVDRTVDRFRTYFLEHVYMLEIEELRFRVKHGIAKARSYGLTYESSISTFLAHMLTLNPDFDKQPAVQRALHDPEIEPDGRMAAMMATVNDEDWKEAAKQCDPRVYWAKLHEERAKEG